MFTLDDPMIALLLRFVGRNQKIRFRDSDFLQKQLVAVTKHIARYPPEDQRARAMEWVESYAREYRDAWVKEIVDDMFVGQRCPDCPMVQVDVTGNCLIHDQWLVLLQQYIADEINARTYVESSLRLLARHKEDLKLCSGALVAPS